MTYLKIGGDLMSADEKRPSVNITECEQLEGAIDESCSFDLKAVKNFTHDIKSSDGWSIGFWVKSVGFRSLSKDGKFYPGLSLLRNISPPEPLFGFGKFSGDFVYPGAYVGTYGVDPDPERGGEGPDPNSQDEPTNGPYARTCKAPPLLLLCFCEVAIWIVSHSVRLRSFLGYWNCASCSLTQLFCRLAPGVEY
jgi:hypothetical protein